MFKKYEDLKPNELGPIENNVMNEMIRDESIENPESFANMIRDESKETNESISILLV